MVFPKAKANDICVKLMTIWLYSEWHWNIR